MISNSAKNTVEVLKATSENRFAFSVFRKCSCFRIKTDANIGIFYECNKCEWVFGGCLRKISRGHFSMQQFVELKSLAKNTVGVYQEHYGIQLKTLLDLYAQIDSKINEVETQIEKVIKELNPPTLSIRGIGEISAAVIVAECGDFSRFNNPNKLLAFAGLEPGKFQSGTLAHDGKMVKRGSSHLRYTLMNCANTVCLHNEVFAEYYRKKNNAGKKHNVARNHVAKKLLRIIFALETKGVMFDTELLR